MTGSDVIKSLGLQKLLLVLKKIHQVWFDNFTKKKMKIMLSSVVSLALLVLVTGGPVPDEFKDVQPDIRKVCLEKSGVSEELVNKAAKGDLIDDPKLKCYLKCVFDQFRLLNKKGMNFTALLALAPPKMKDDTIEMVKQCRNSTGTDLCDLSFNISKCFFETKPDTYFIL